MLHESPEVDGLSSPNDICSTLTGLDDDYTSSLTEREEKTARTVLGGLFLGSAEPTEEVSGGALNEMAWRPFVGMGSRTTDDQVEPNIDCIASEGKGAGSSPVFGGWASADAKEERKETGTAQEIVSKATAESTNHRCFFQNDRLAAYGGLDACSRKHGRDSRFLEPRVLHRKIVCRAILLCGQ